MTEDRRPTPKRLRWIVISCALIAVAYLGTVLWGLLNEANMAFRFLQPERIGIERLLTARDDQATQYDSILTPRQLSTMLMIADRIMAVDDGTDRPQRTRDVLVSSLNASSMTLREYRYVRDVIAASLKSRSSTYTSDSLATDRLSVILPRFQNVRSFFTERLDSIGLAPTF